MCYWGLLVSAHVKTIIGYSLGYWLAHNVIQIDYFCSPFHVSYLGDLSRLLNLLFC